MEIEELKRLCKEKTSIQFVADMIEAGLEEKLTWYIGRNSWKGPAVSVNYLQEALSETKVSCNYDRLGLGYIVHPVKSERWAHE